MSYIYEKDAYHEAGHAVMYAYYGIRIRYVSISPIGGYSGMVVADEDPSGADRIELANWMRTAAAGEAAGSHCINQPMPESGKLIARFNLALEDVNQNPGYPPNDLRNFVTWGRQRDRGVHNSDASRIGPENWVPIWLEAENLIRGELWPAVEAVKQRLWEIAQENIDQEPVAWPTLSGDETAAIVSQVLAAQLSRSYAARASSKACWSS